MFKEFKEFIERGNVMDMAVGIIIGAAFTAIVTSLVSDIIMPFISLFTGGVDFTSMKVVLSNGASFNYGSFINAIIQFVLIAFVVFLLVRGMNKLHNATEHLSGDKPAPEKKPPVCPACLEEVKEGATRCPHCGEKFDAPAKSE